ncbi:MAG: JAB domain-containing protein [Gammaproteobacteria bacterium]|nr:JAB domain-containing protein [Gammaproteobacteria bacterium]
MAISDWPEEERPREKLLQRGAAALSDAELLAIFLRTGVHGKTALDLARELLVKFNGLRALMDANQESFCSANGLGPAKYVQLQAVMELNRRHMEARWDRGQAVSSPTEMRSYLQAQMRDHRHEVFACLFLDNKHRVISFDKMFFGTIDGASVYPREIVKRALDHNAAAVILTHNHPSGIAEPSQADIAITQRLKDALNLIDVRILDHFVIGDGEIVSLAERSLL